MKRIVNFFSKNRFFIAVLFLGALLRFYKPLSLFPYGHDQDLAGWIVKDILSGHLRLIGQQTSSLGIFIGPLFYYLQIPFYLMTGLDPFGTFFLPLIISLFTIFSIYFVFGKIWRKEVGLIAAFIYAASAVIVFTDREAVPTMPVHLWSVWYFFALWLLGKGIQKAYILIGVLFGLVWHLNLALAVISPLVLIAQYFSRKKINLRYVLSGLVSLGILMLPFFVFELRHGFIQTTAIYESFTTQKDYVPGTGVGSKKLDRVMQLVKVNTRNLYWGTRIPIREDLIFYLLIITFIVLVKKKIISKQISFLMILWQVLFVVFFTFNSINVSEYYLNGMNIVWILIGALGINNLFQVKKSHAGWFLIVLFLLINVNQAVEKKSNGSGYLERKAIVSYIYEDAKSHNYPCVSVSYITSPGNDLGYRYLFWLKEMRVEQSKSGAPVYSIVFPLSMVSRVDKTFGKLGLVLPDYERYNDDGVEVSCSGGNSNLTDPMFGYTE
jgi:4-amino-4-deoxy-L-arabinose transferase-like glycosyltransferase